MRVFAACLGLLVALAAPGVQPAAAARADDVWAGFATAATGAPQSIGSYSNGCLVGAAALPLQGIGYEVMRPSRNRYWGHPALIAFIEDLAFWATGAGLGDVLVGDLGLPRGGPMPTGHRSHQIGLDADIWLRIGAPAGAPVETVPPVLMVPAGTFAVDPSVWTQDQVDLIHAAASDPRIARVFVNPAIKLALCQMDWPDRTWLRTVRPWWGHDDHFHIRLACPEGDATCIPQDPPPEGDGCGAELMGWFPDPNRAWPPPPPPPHAPPPLPAACQALLATWQAAP